MPNSYEQTAAAVPMPMAEKAWLTYQALNLSDDVILLLEVPAGKASAEPVIVGANGAFRRASGFSNDQLLGRQATELFPVEDHAEALRQAVRDGTALRTELNCKRASGGTFILGLHLMPAPARSAGGNCFVALGRDITAAVEARQTQASVQRLLAKVFTSVDEAVSIVNAAGQIVMTNPGYDRLLGYKPNEMVGRKALDVVAPDAHASFVAAIEEQFKHGRDVSFTTAYLRADGSKMVLRITSVIVTTDMKQFRISTLRPDTGGKAGSRILSAGRITLVGLDDVRLALGDRWKAVADRVLGTAEAVLKRRCGAQDSYSRAGETSFLVCFGALSEKEAAFRAAMISREIRTRLIGQGEEPDTAYVRSLAAAIRVPDEGDGAPAAHDLLLDGLNQHMERVEAEARQTLAGSWASATCVLDPVLGLSVKQTVSNRIGLAGKVRRTLMSALSVLPRTEAEAFDLDALLLGLAAKQAIADMGRGVSTPLLADIRFDVFLTRAATQRYFAACQRIDPRVSSRLVLMMSALPEGLPKTRLLDCVTRLRPFCAGVGYYVDDLTAAAQIDLSNSFNPIMAVPFKAMCGVPADKVRMTIDALHARRAALLVFRVPADKDIGHLRQAGVDMISFERSAS